MIGPPHVRLPARPTGEYVMRRAVLVLLPLLLAASSVHAEVRAKEVEYRADGTVLKGYLAYDDRISGRRPGVLVVHEWWGHNDYARKRARMLADLGYTALAVDMFGDGRQAAHPDEAGKLATEVSQNITLSKARFLAALELLKHDPNTDPTRIGAIGYCFGGGVVLQMAREGVDLAGVASFHGMLSTARPAPAGAVKAKVLVLHGADDPFVPPAQVEQFKDEMKRAQVDLRFVAYPGAVHAFTNPDADALGKKFNLPLRYDAAADKASWAEMQALFQRVFAR